MRNIDNDVNPTRHEKELPQPADIQENEEDMRCNDATSKWERTQNRILDAALDLFSQSGSNGVSLRAIAKEAGISHAGLLKHFNNKDELILAAIARRDHFPGTEEVSNFDDLSPEDYLALILEAIEKNAENPGTVALFVKLAAEATHVDHPAHYYFKARYNKIISMLAASIVYISNCDYGEAEKRAQEFVAFVDGIQIQWLLHPDKVDMLEATRDYLQRVGLL